MTDSKKLRQRIADSGLKLNYIAEKIGISRYALAMKIDNKSFFRVNEVETLCDLLGINTLTEKNEIFFAKEVENISTH